MSIQRKLQPSRGNIRKMDPMANLQVSNLTTRFCHGFANLNNDIMQKTTVPTVQAKNQE